MQVLKKVDGISFCELTSKDVVRHPLVQKIVQAYDEYEKKAKPENHSGRSLFRLSCRIHFHLQRFSGHSMAGNYRKRVVPI